MKVHGMFNYSFLFYTLIDFIVFIAVAVPLAKGPYCYVNTAMAAGFEVRDYLDVFS